MKILLKIVLSLAIIVNVVSNTYSQKIRTKSENIKYTRLPLISLPDHVKTYCNVFSPYDSDMKTITDNYKNYMRMNGYEITDIANADIILELKIGPFTLESKKIRNDMIPLYNGEGEKTGTRVVYQYSLEFTCPAKFIISERNGQVILDSLIYSLSSPIYDYWGEENYLSESSLAENWIFYEKSVLDNKKKSIVSNVIEQINQFLNDFSSQEVIDNVFFYSYKTTKKEKLWTSNQKGK